MLIAWMAYATLLTALICCAAVAAERAVAIWRAGRRFVWLAALVAGIVVPALLSVRRIAIAPAVPSVSPSPALPSDGAAIPLDVSALTQRPSTFARAQQLFVTLDPYLRDVWLAASLALLMLFGRAAIGLHRQRSRWREINLAGAHLLLAPNAGPAVVGVLHPRVVVPQWALSLDPAARELMLRHEAEHIRARDPHLLAVAAFSLVLFPWNAGLWFVVRRLRLAIEVDCDQRVLRGAVQARDYGLLLLTVGARHSASLPLAVSLAERRPFLERRIRAMTTPRPRKPMLASLALMSVAVGVTTAAAKAPRPAPFMMHAPTASASRAPQRVADESIVRAPSRAYTAVPTKSTRGPGVPIELIRTLIALHHPNVIIGDSSVNLITLVLDQNLNYVYSTAGKAPTGQATVSYEGRVRFKEAPVGSAAPVSDTVAANMEIEAVRAVALKRAMDANFETGRMLGQADLREVPVSEVSDSVRVRYAALEKFAAEASMKARQLDGISPDAISSVEVRKFSSGTLAAYDLGVLVVVLKGDGGK